MGEQLSEANRALIERVLGHLIEPRLIRTLEPSTLESLLNAARSEGLHPESGEAGLLASQVHSILKASFPMASPVTTCQALGCILTLLPASPPQKVAETLPVVSEEMVEAGAAAMERLRWRRGARWIAGEKTPKGINAERENARACLEAAFLSRGEG